MSETPTLRQAAANDFDAISALLGAAHLPVAGIEEHLAGFIVAESRGAVVGCVGLEMYGNAGLLRSLAVSADWRSAGLGQQLTRACLSAARAANVTTVVLLTETADHFFPRFGFKSVDRRELPASVQASQEFRGVCPASARAMMLDLGDHRA